MQGNDFIKFVLRSPLHGLLSGNILLITVTGRKTGRITTLPVQYLRMDNELWITSTRERIWWRNLRGGADVSLYLGGQEVKTRAEVVEDEPGVAAGFREYFQKAPRSAKYLNVKLDSQGNPKAEDIANLTRQRVIVRVAQV